MRTEKPALLQKRGLVFLFLFQLCFELILDAEYFGGVGVQNHAEVCERVQRGHGSAQNVLVHRLLRYAQLPRDVRLRMPAFAECVD